jgi:hypothetical protein
MVLALEDVGLQLQIGIGAAGQGGCEIPEKMSAIREKGMAFKEALDLAPGKYTVRFVVRDNLSGRIGSVGAPLEVE